jgi:hypothetical protein
MMYLLDFGANFANRLGEQIITPANACAVLIDLAARWVMLFTMGPMSSPETT